MKSFCAECLTYLSMFSDDVRMFSCMYQNLRFSWCLNVTVLYEFSNVENQKCTPNCVVCNVWALCWDIFEVTKVVVHMILNHCRHVFVVTFFLFSAGGFITPMWLLFAREKITFTLDVRHFALWTVKNVELCAGIHWLQSKIWF